MHINVLVADDEAPLRSAIAEALRREGLKVYEAGDPKTALRCAEDVDLHIVLADLLFDDSRQTGIDILRQMSETSPDTFFIILTGRATVDTAVESLRLGAYDYLRKPVKIDEIVSKVNHLANYRQLNEENRRLRKQMHQSYHHIGSASVVGESEAMQQVGKLVGKVASTSSTVLVTGESGTGKEVIARAIHAGGEHAEEPFVPIDCASIPATLLESELFGHEKGAFTGATSNKQGLFVVAGEGTLFLDEIGEVPQQLQVKLLRAIEEKSVQPVGSTERVPVNARIIAATNRDLAREVEQGRYRADLFYRLNVVQINVPPLRERRQDIPVLVNYFIDHFNAELREDVTGADNAAMRALMAYSWKGNVRELENVIERAMILSDTPVIGREDLPTSIVGASHAVAPHETDYLVQKVASTDSTVLIIGESGTGKEVTAKAVHQQSPRASGPFVPVHCAAIPYDLLESELFGHVKGSFTGAVDDKEGLFVSAGEGTLFLDEVGEIPLSVQVKLLRALEERNVQPVGSTERVPIKARIVAATNRDLAAAVNEGSFRDDLYYRLKVVQIDLRPLRDRMQDIPDLAAMFIEHFNNELGKNVTRINDEASLALKNYSWKGNVRELENVIERAIIISEDEVIGLDDLPANIVAETSVATDNLAEAVNVFEEQHIREVLSKVGYDTRKSCKALDIARSTFFKKLKTYGISLKELRNINKS